MALSDRHTNREHEQTLRPEAMAPESPTYHHQQQRVPADSPNGAHSYNMSNIFILTPHPPSLNYQKRNHPKLWPSMSTCIMVFTFNTYGVISQSGGGVCHPCSQSS